MAMSESAKNYHRQAPDIVETIVTCNYHQGALKCERLSHVLTSKFLKHAINK